MFDGHDKSFGVPLGPTGTGVTADSFGDWLDARARRLRGTEDVDNGGEEPRIGQIWWDPFTKKTYVYGPGGWVEAKVPKIPLPDEARKGLQSVVKARKIWDRALLKHHGEPMRRALGITWDDSLHEQFKTITKTGRILSDAGVRAVRDSIAGLPLLSKRDPNQTHQGPMRRMTRDEQHSFQAEVDLEMQRMMSAVSLPPVSYGFEQFSNPRSFS